MKDVDNPDWSEKFNDEHAEAVQYCVDEVKRITAEIGAKGGRIEITVKVNEDCWGTVDVLIWSTEYVVVLDFKFGRGKSVGVEGNPQLMLYYLGAMRFLHDEGVESIPQKGKLYIVQPRLPNPTREWETTFPEIKTWYTKSVKPAYTVAETKDAPCNPGAEQCQFCPANGVCNSRADYLLGVAEEEFKDYAVPAEGVGKTENLPTVQAQTKDIRKIMDTGLEILTPDIASKILAYQGDFDNFFKKVGEYAVQSALDGIKIPGYKIVYGRSNRKWSKPEVEIIAKLKELDVDPHAKKLISPAQAEKKLGKKRKGEIGDFVEKPLGKKILVEESDTREEVDLTGEADMAEFAEPPPAEIATSSTPDDVNIFETPDVGEIDDIMSGFDGEVKEEVTEEKHDEIWPGNNPSAPNKKTKKYQLMEMGLKGGVPLKEAADEFFNGDVGQVKKGLRNLNERDGFTIVIHGDQTFTVKED